MVLKSVATASLWPILATASRWACSVPPLPSVTSFSASGRAALALARVVLTRLWRMRLATRLASMASRCCEVRPSLRVFFWWRMALLGFGFGDRKVDEAGFELHAKAEAEVLELVLDFVERFLAE